MGAGAPGAGDIRLRIPGFRKYALEITRLRREVAEVEALRARVAEAEAELGALRASRGLAPGNDLAPEEADWLARAKQFEYYWLNANKKLDVLALRPFGPAAAQVLRDGRTFLNADRLYTLWQAIERMPEAGAAVAEVGAFKGGSAKLIAEALRASGRTVPLFVCDTFAGHTVVDESIDGRHRVGKQFRAVRAPKVAKYLSTYEFLEVVEGDIRETAARFADQHAFGMVHIDVDVHPITQFCLEFFAPRIPVGATIVVDDYGFTTCKGVKKAVDDFVAAHPRMFWAMHLLTAQAVLVRVS
jgi:O-methyltransferase